MRARECCHLRFLILLSIYFFNKKNFPAGINLERCFKYSCDTQTYKVLQNFFKYLNFGLDKKPYARDTNLIVRNKENKTLYYKNLTFNLLYTPSGLGILFCCLTTGNIWAIQMYIIQMQIQLKVYVQDFFLSAFYESVIFIYQKCEQFFHCMD